MMDLRARPFFLDTEGVRWVEDCLKMMTLEEKVGQLFCAKAASYEEVSFEHLTQKIKIGGLLYRPESAEELREKYCTIQSMSKVPLLLAANAEAGGDGAVKGGTSFGKAMAVAATQDLKNAYRMGEVACAECAALGVNWSFAPVVDIDMEFHNPITNIRTFGSDPEQIIACATEYMKAADEHLVAATIKHFPGDGVDERDQHLLTSVNSLSCEEWDDTYGKIYQTLIERNVKSVMVGHIAMPAYVKKIKPNATIQELLCPASLSKELITGLLRNKLGFNGLLVTDSTLMVGFMAAMPRRIAIPSAIAAGMDMILFNKNLEEDYQYLMDGVKEGVVSKERLDDAVTRILATKAALKLHVKQKENKLVPEKEKLKEIGAEPFPQWAKEVADKAITLVKDIDSLLPISPEKYPHVYLNVIQRDINPQNEFVQMWKELFEREGFDVAVRDRSAVIGGDQNALEKEMYRSVENTKEAYDLYVYIANMENASNNTTLRLNWKMPHGLGDDSPWMAAEVPMLLISTAYPYHMFDAPMVPTLINAYSGKKHFCEAVMDKIMGRSAFTGHSPVDPFCGKDYLRMMVTE